MKGLTMRFEKQSWARRARAISAVACGLAMVGCATRYDQQHDHADGWRIGRVVKVGNDLPSGPPPTVDCRLAANTSVPSNAHFVEVKFSERRHVRYRIAVLADDRPFAPGDEVYVNLSSCTAPVVRWLPAAARA